MRGRHTVRYAIVASFSCVLFWGAEGGRARAAPPTEEILDVRLAILRVPQSGWNERKTAWSRLAWEVRRRTSIAIDLSTASVDPETDALFDHPFLIWQGTRAFPALTRRAIANLRRHLLQGGTILVDVNAGGEGGGFHRAVLRELGRILPREAPRRVSPEHVLYKSFYLLDRQGGRVLDRSYMTGLFVGDRLAVVLSTNDLAGAMERDSFGQWRFEVEVGGEATREVTFRMGINLLMYALCLDYKEDQVHIPFILKRRR